MLNFTKPIPLSIYIHFPWCVRKCPYCDFNSHQLKNDIPEEEYINALIDDFELMLPQVWGRHVHSIFMGGGTPSLFSGASMERLLKALHARLPFGPDCEITLEANPGTVEQERFDAFRQAGINRLSIGVQSLQDEKLIALGRIHNRDAAINAAHAAKSAGFDNFNLDIMYGLPQQTQEEALTDLQQAIELNPTHLSWYQLTLEPNTLFHHKPPTLPQHDAIYDMQTAGQALLAENGYKQYEISAYSQPKRQCLHNVNYWEFGDYVGIGAGAHSKITDVAKGTITRTVKHKHPTTYLQKKDQYILEQKNIPETELPFEFMLNALRLYQPISFELFEERTGLSIETIKANLHTAQSKDFVTVTDEQIQITQQGYNFYNDLVELFV